MTGAEHYEAAEGLLVSVDPYEDDPENAITLAAAQVHATLALADAQRRATEALRKANR